jgi:hypothetical protein
VGRLIAIDALSFLAVLAAWYFCFLRYNHKKAAAALRWVEAACSGRGKVVDAHWEGASRLQAQLRFAAHWFENAHVIVRLLPRPVPFHWLFSLYRKQRETLRRERRPQLDDFAAWSGGADDALGVDAGTDSGGQHAVDLARA